MESIETVTITNPANPILIWWVIAQPLLLLLSYLVGRATRFLLRGRATVSDAAATLIALVGLWLGLLLAGWLFDEGDLFSVKMLATSCGVAVVVLVATSAVLARVQHHPTLLPIAEVAQMGESDRLEFKSSARWNLRTDKRDEAMEEVVAKTVAAFMNSAGGTLLLGVDDGGNLIGLGPDYATLKQPDADRFELWLRGMWRTRFGTSRRRGISYLRLTFSWPCTRTQVISGKNRRHPTPSDMGGKQGTVGHCHDPEPFSQDREKAGSLTGWRRRLRPSQAIVPTTLPADHPEDGRP